MKQDLWTGRLGFILAAVGSAVGLGSIWKFPYEMGQHGGAAFLLFYVLGLVLVVVPLMLAEFALGRRGRGDAAASLASVASRFDGSPRWEWLGLLGIVCGVLILSFYSVIGGWTLAYAVEVALDGLPAAGAATARERYDALLGSPLRAGAYHALFIGLACAIVARGVAGGIEAACKILMPILAILMLLLAAYSVTTGNVDATLAYLFRLDPADLTPRAALEALGLGLFSIGVGFGLMITYAAYAPASIDLRQAALLAVAFDTVVSLAAGLAVFPIVFANGLDAAGGPGLVFLTLPIAFAAMPFGRLAAQAFFVLLFVAALASAISMLELAVAYAVRRFGWSRAKAALACTAACFVLGLGTVASMRFFEALDALTSNVMLPLGALGVSLLCGWALPARLLAEELGLGPRGSRFLRFLLRYAAPAVIVLVTLGPLAR